MIFLAFVVPLAVYFLLLAYVNRSHHPVMVSGPWDFAGVLFAASGFLLLGGPAILTGFHEHWRMSWLLGRTHFPLGLGEHWFFWVSLWAVYFVAILGSAVYLLRRRRGQTSIYNIEPAVFEEVFAGVLDRLGLEWVRGRPGRIVVRPREELLPGTGGTPGEALPPPVYLAYPSCGAILDVETFALLRHVTLHWLGEVNGVRPEVEAELAKALAQVYCRENPAGGWFMSLAVGLFIVAFFALVGILALRVFQLLR